MEIKRRAVERPIDTASLTRAGGTFMSNELVKVLCLSFSRSGIVRVLCRCWPAGEPGCTAQALSARQRCKPMWALEQAISALPLPRRKADRLPESHTAGHSAVAARFAFGVAEKRADRYAQGDTCASRVRHLGL